VQVERQAPRDVHGDKSAERPPARRGGDHQVVAALRHLTVELVDQVAEVLGEEHPLTARCCTEEHVPMGHVPQPDDRNPLHQPAGRQGVGGP
jgi:hypothetical protein